MIDFEKMDAKEAEDFLEKVENGTYTCKLILTKNESGFCIHVDTEEIDEIVRAIISFGWCAVMEGENFNLPDTLQ